MTVNTDGTRHTSNDPALDDVGKLAWAFGLAVQGDDAKGLTDVEWAAGKMRTALAFAARATDLGWFVDFRDPVRSVTDSGVLQVWTSRRVNAAVPRNCPTCQTVDWWTVPFAVTRRDDFHNAGHPVDGDGKPAQSAAAAAQYGGGPKMDRCPWCETKQRLTVAGFLVTHNDDSRDRVCGGSGLRPTDSAPEREPAAKPEPARGSAEYNQGLLSQWGI